jgi:hypothetical protein
VLAHVPDGNRRRRDEAAVEDAAGSEDLDEVRRVGEVAPPFDGDEKSLGPEDGRREYVEGEVQDLLVRKAGAEGLPPQQPDPGQVRDRQDDAVGGQVERADVDEPRF